MSSPKVTVCMTLYSGDKGFLIAAIESILNQTFKDFEFLIISEFGASEEVVKTIDSFSDPRIIHVKNEYNMGLNKSRNRALDLAKGEYIAVMDSDDIAYPAKLEKQVKFMDENLEVGICGTRFRVIGSVDGEPNIKYILKLPENHDDIKIQLLLVSSNPICHSTVVFRRSYLNKYNLRYDDSILAAEDCDLWVRASQYFRLAIIKEVLLDYRRHEFNTSKIIQDDICVSCKEIAANQLRNLGLNPSKAEIDLHYKVGHLAHLQNNLDNSDIIAWFNKIIEVNKKSSIYDQKKLEHFLTKDWFNPLKRCQHFNFKIFLFRFMKNPKIFVDYVKYGVKCTMLYLFG